MLAMVVLLRLVEIPTNDVSSYPSSTDHQMSSPYFMYTYRKSIQHDYSLGLGYNDGAILNNGKRYTLACGKCKLLSPLIDTTL